MAVNPADSPIFGTLYGSETMRAIFDEQALLQRMLDTEAALARIEARLGLIPDAAAEAITAAARIEALDLSGLPASVRNVGYPVVGLVAALSRAAGAEAGRWTHWGATTQDILDTAVALQVKAGLALLRADLRHLIAALAAQAAAHRGTVMASAAASRISPSRASMRASAASVSSMRCNSACSSKIARIVSEP